MLFVFRFPGYFVMIFRAKYETCGSFRPPQLPLEYLLWTLLVLLVVARLFV
jgi:hypothetical protein